MGLGQCLEEQSPQKRLVCRTSLSWWDSRSWNIVLENPEWFKSSFYEEG